jgi:hypothetical protein
MRGFSPLSDLDALDERFLGPFAALAGAHDIVVLDTYRGLNKQTGEISEAEDTRDAAIYIEWVRRKGRFGLDINAFGPGMPRDVTRVHFARSLAGLLDRPLLASDCSLFGFSWLKHDPDGTIWEVVSDVNDIDNFDLLCDLDPSHPDFTPAKLIFAANEPLPMPASEERTRYCEQNEAQTLRCSHFGSIGGCPKLRARR